MTFVRSSASAPESRSDSFGKTWVYELDDHGYVLHSSIRPPEVEDSTAPGTNLFFDVDAVAEPEQLRRRFDAFVRGDKAMESFDVARWMSADPAPARVTFVKTFETGPRNAPLVMMEIRS